MTRLRQLSDLLRDQTKWPDDFVWDYSHADQCAIGLACVTDVIDRVNSSFVTYLDFPEMTERQFEAVFYDRGQHLNYEEVTAHEVADRIDELLEA